MGELDSRGRLWTTQTRTLNQLVEGSSPSRLTELLREPKTESRADERGSSVVREDVATRSVCEEWRALTAAWPLDRVKS
jgi:hypothetical protein